MFPVSTSENDTPGRERGRRYLDQQLTLIGFGGHGANAELSRISGIGESIISKWRRGKSMPTRDRLRDLLDAVAPHARRIGVSWEPTEFFIEFGLISRGDLQQDPVDDLYSELIRLDREAGLIDEFEQQVLRRHVQMLVEGTRRTLAEKRAAKPGTGRKAS